MLCIIRNSWWCTLFGMADGVHYLEWLGTGGVQNEGSSVVLESKQT